jgi:hypothetical protein
MRHQAQQLYGAASPASPILSKVPASRKYQSQKLMGNCKANGAVTKDRPIRAQVMQLPQKQNADDDMQILRWASHPTIKMTHQFINWKIIKKVISEHPRPRAI